MRKGPFLVSLTPGAYRILLCMYVPRVRITRNEFHPACGCPFATSAGGSGKSTARGRHPTALPFDHGDGRWMCNHHDHTGTSIDW